MPVYLRSERCELARLILERALEHITNLGVTVCIHRPPGNAAPIQLKQLRFRHPDESNLVHLISVKSSVDAHVKGEPSSRVGVTMLLSWPSYSDKEQSFGTLVTARGFHAGLISLGRNNSADVAATRPLARALKK